MVSYVTHNAVQLSLYCGAMGFMLHSVCHGKLGFLCSQSEIQLEALLKLDFLLRKMGDCHQP